MALWENLGSCVWAKHESLVSFIRPASREGTQSISNRIQESSREVNKLASARRRIVMPALESRSVMSQHRRRLRANDKRECPLFYGSTLMSFSGTGGEFVDDSGRSYQWASGKATGGSKKRSPGGSNWPIFIKIITSSTALLLLSAIIAPVVEAVDCFKCSSRNGSNPACEDPFHNINTTRIISPVLPDPLPGVIYHAPCYAGKKGRGGLFPASTCIKLTGTFGCVLACPEDACNRSGPKLAPLNSRLLPLALALSFIRYIQSSGYKLRI